MTHDSRLIAACSAAVNELKASRELIETLDIENSAIRTRLETEKRASQILTELNETRTSEAEALRATVNAKNNALVAKDEVITSQQKLIDELRRKRPSLWRRIGDILIGAGAIAVLK